MDILTKEIESKAEIIRHYKELYNSKNIILQQISYSKQQGGELSEICISENEGLYSINLKNLTSSQKKSLLLKIEIIIEEFKKDDGEKLLEELK